MVKHIVLWKLDAGYSESEREEIRSSIKSRLYQLKREIDVLLYLEVYWNSREASASNYDIMLDSGFSTFNDLASYQSHPAHVKVAEYIKSLRMQRSAIDFLV
jgi:hypothetical protein